MMTRKQHLILLVMEECGEVAHRCSKAARFGMSEVQPGQDLNNAERLAAELTDLHTIVRMLEEECGYFLLAPTQADARVKREKVEMYMVLSRELGQLCEENKP